MISPYPNALFIQSTHPTPLTLPLMYFALRPQILGKMTENEMKIFHVLLSICLLYYNLYSLNLYNNQWFCTHF
jgi:hypothetical protein